MTAKSQLHFTFGFIRVNSMPSHAVIILKTGYLRLTAFHVIQLQHDC